MVLAPRRGYKLHIGAGNIVVLELLPELCNVVGSYQLAKHLINKAGRVGTAKAKHIAFGIQPVA